MLTRYLYDRSQVEHSLFTALLERNADKAKFWTFELYHSGFAHDTVALLWKLYYQLYAGFYVNFERFLSRMTADWLKDPRNDVAIGNMVENMANKEPCIEFYRIINGNLQAPSHMEKWIEKIRSATDAPECYKIMERFIEKHGCFKTRGTEIYSRMRDVFSQIKTLDLYILKCACISRMFTGVFLLDPQNGFDDRMNIILDKSDIAKYKNKPFVEGKCWKLVRRECIYKLDIDPDYKQEDMYDYNDDKWTFHVAFSPLWLKRITKYGGKVNETEGRIIFDDDETEEAFYNWFNVDPDEQPAEVKSKWLGQKTYGKWEDIYTKYACTPFNEWMSTYT